MIPRLEKLAAGGLVTGGAPLIGVEGCEYLIPSKIGIGITTTPERNVLDLVNWKGLIPEGADFIIVNDAAHFGVAHSKNELLRQLQYCDHIFLFDDDTYPIAPNWWRPYIEHPEPHLMYQFKLPSKPADDMRELYRDETTVAYSHTRGAMIYIERRVLDVVGGMDTAYGLAGYEHPDWTNRIHNAGLTTHRAMDVPNSDHLLYCLDQDGLVESSIPGTNKPNHELYRRSKLSREYKEYKS